MALELHYASNLPTTSKSLPKICLMWDEESAC